MAWRWSCAVALVAALLVLAPVRATSSADSGSEALPAHTEAREADHDASTTCTFVFSGFLIPFCE